MPKEINSSPNKSSLAAPVSPRPKKNNTKTKEPTLTELKREWHRRCEENPWRPPATGFRHDNLSVVTITAGDAESLDGIKPKLKPTELAILPHEWRPSPHNRDRKMKLFNKDDVRRLIRERCKAWNVDVPSPSVGGPFSERFNDKGVIEKHEYIPPPNASPDDPNPSEINWIGQHLPAPALMNEKEACFMYLLEPRDLDPLRGSSTSSWFDQKSVAIRAATVHGGVRNHNQLIINKRLEDIENGEATQEMPAGLKKFLKYLNDPGPYGEYDSANDPVKSVEQKNKEIWQYLPVYEDGTFENGQNPLANAWV